MKLYEIILLVLLFLLTPSFMADHSAYQRSQIWSLAFPGKVEKTMVKLDMKETMYSPVVT